MKRNARVSTDRINKMQDLPFQYAQRHMVSTCFSFPGY
jgi:hypothetical protein